MQVHLILGTSAADYIHGRISIQGCHNGCRMSGIMGVVYSGQEYEQRSSSSSGYALSKVIGTSVSVSHLQPDHIRTFTALMVQSFGAAVSKLGMNNIPCKSCSTKPYCYWIVCP